MNKLQHLIELQPCHIILQKSLTISAITGTQLLQQKEHDYDFKTVVI